MSPGISPLPRPRSLRAFLLALLLPLFVLGGCATTNPRDPLEPMNRAIYSFNDGLDKVLIKPVAEGYRAVLPNFVRTGVSNVFSNINDVLIALNNLLQGKLVSAISDVGRVLVNTTVGIAGFFDVAMHFGLEKHDEDFGQTLGYWGIGDGPYLVLPVLGPSNFRDFVGRLADYWKADPITYVQSMSLRNTLWGLRGLSARAELLDTSKILETAALDPYEFLRDAYLQRRRNLVHDGAPPREKDDGAELDVAPQAGSGAAPPVARPAEDAVAPSGTTVFTMPADEGTPARAEATEPAATPATAAPLAQQPAPAATPDVATPAAAPAEVNLPSEPSAAGETAQELRETTQRVIRVWVSAAN